MRLFAGARAFQRSPTAGLCDIAQNTGYIFNGYADILGVRDGSLLAVDGGGTSLTSRLRFVDLSGLAERRIAVAWQRKDMTGLRNYIFDEVKPTFVKIWPGWDERIQLDLPGDPRLERDYTTLLPMPDGGGLWVVAMRRVTTRPWTKRGGGGRESVEPGHPGTRRGRAQPGGAETSCGPVRITGAPPPRRR